MNTKITNLKQSYQKPFAITLLLCAFGSCMQPVHAEGSRSLYPSGITGYRANLEWRNNAYGPAGNASLLRRTLLQVYANKDEYILLGSSAVGVDSGDILVYNKSSVSGRIGNEIISGTPELKCSDQRSATGNTNQGKIINRDQELAGPDTIKDDTKATPGNQVTSGYVPCYYKAKSSGIYYVVFYGTTGNNSDANGIPTGEIDLSSSNNFNNQQGTSVAAWDVTVRSSLTSTTDLKGRLFADYLTLFTGINDRPMESVFYTATKDGYRYRTALNGLDPNGFVIYGNDVGYYDSDGKTPLYHNVLGDSGSNSGSLAILKGGTNLALPTHLVFFSDPIAYATQAEQAIIARGLPTIPIPPKVSNPSFTGTAGGYISNQNTGGTFKFDSDTPGSYEIIISKSGTDFTPDKPENRMLRGLMPFSGSQAVTWDGKDNNGNFFPVGTDYKVQIRVRNGEYHFPLIDAENSTKGGPSFTLLNGVSSSTIGYYDDRGYRTLSGVDVDVLCGQKPPSTISSLQGFDTTSNQRAFGPGDNKNTPCTGSFGDAKGLDIWTYIASNVVITPVTIVAPPLTADKTVILAVDNDKSNTITAGDILEYTVVVTNTSSIATANQVVLTDNIPTNTTYVSGSLKIDTVVKTDVASDDQADFSTDKVIFRLGTGANTTAGGSIAPKISTTINFRVKIADPLPPGITTVSNQAVVSSNGAANVNSNDPSTTPANDPTVTKIAPRLRLVKRVTGMKKFSTGSFTAIGGYNDLATDVNDDATVGWTPNANAYLLGAISGDQIPTPNPGVPGPKDEVEYTIYFLVDGGIPAKTVDICDFVPANQTYVPGTMQLSLNGGTANAIADTPPSLNASGFYSASFPAACTGINNSRGAAYFQVGDVNSSSYGFIRFRAKVN